MKSILWIRDLILQENALFHWIRRKILARKPTPDIGAPIIIIGNGGSGSSLLDRILNAHPCIVMKGEMKFLVPRAWTVFWEADANTPLRNLKQRFDAEPDLENRIIGSPEQYRQFIRELEQAERLRTGMALRQCLDEWFCVSEESARFWGFKEIMNGAAHRHDWDEIGRASCRERV